MTGPNRDRSRGPGFGSSDRAIGPRVDGLKATRGDSWRLDRAGATELASRHQSFLQRASTTMVYFARFALACSLLLSLGPAFAGEYNQVLDIGDDAPAWRDLIGVDDQKHSLEELADSDVVVVIFTCNSCPYAVDAEDRLIALQEKYADDGVTLVAINVNKVDEDLLPAMKEKSKEKSFPFAYLFDETQQIARDYGAIFTPECYVLDADRKVRYMGALDDSPDGRSVTKKHVESAIDALLAGGQPAVTETVPIGCRVRYERTRRRRKSQ